MYAYNNSSAIPSAYDSHGPIRLFHSSLLVGSDFRLRSDSLEERDAEQKTKALNSRILIADDQEAVRKRICSTLATCSNFTVCGEAKNGKEAVEKAEALRPDLVILDITMPLMNGLDAARAIHSFLPNTPIIILSVHKSRQLVEEARRIGVMGYVTKEDAVQSLIPAADAVLRNQTFFPTEI